MEAQSLMDGFSALLAGDFETALAAARAQVTVLSSGAAGMLGGAWLALKSWRSRIRSAPKEGAWFEQADLMTLPTERPAYSDRMAWVLAEMADLAYFRFEAPVDDARRVEEILEHSGRFTADTAQALIDGIRRDAVRGDGGEAALRAILEAHGFGLLRTFDVGPLQGFLCRDQRPGVPEALILAFRGTEKNVGDWLTDADAAPTSVVEIPDAIAHSGFYRSFHDAAATLREAIDDEAPVGADGERLPLFVTGHSLGGAWAMLATALLAPDRPGACYTYGAPRIANYELFFTVKTPVFRVVNSADIVPRVPPGVLIVPVLYWTCRALARLTTPIAFLSDSLERLARYVDALKDYRHSGDQRYLTDVTGGRFEQSRLLQNPPLADRALWFWKGMLAGITYPVKSHSMAIYRKKLAAIARQRQAAHARAHGARSEPSP